MTADIKLNDVSVTMVTSPESGSPPGKMTMRWSS